MDQKNFIPIGIVDVLWEYELVNEIRKAYLEIYIPEEVNYKYGHQYCNRFVFLDKDNVITVETDETTKFSFQKIGIENKMIKIKLLENVIFVNQVQFDKINNIICEYNLIQL